MILIEDFRVFYRIFVKRNALCLQTKFIGPVETEGSEGRSLLKVVIVKTAVQSKRDPF